ncbi:hypothetical protein CLV30_11763 [Haloactinopolyspora alba]|uniref:Uncharacterized protein n=1 Tax=Haloactinopolyspora alba TaxID=648780 RepID=A0A2P8DRC1_9ACTN|nr:hypothetical protein CLV30_11763 [Haloactinopolyspora alba]
MSYAVRCAVCSDWTPVRGPSPVKRPVCAHCSTEQLRPGRIRSACVHCRRPIVTPSFVTRPVCSACRDDAGRNVRPVTTKGNPDA